MAAWLTERFRFGMVSTTRLSLSMRGRYKIEIAEWKCPPIKKMRYAKEQTRWSSTVVLLYQRSADTNLCRGFTLVHALSVVSVDEHKHNPARMRYSKFVHYVQNYRQTPHR